jgi:glycosyltransferase 2 family protein
MAQFKKIFQFVLMVSPFAYIYYSVTWSEFLQAMETISLLLLSVITIVVFVSIFLQGFRWWILLRVTQKELPLLPTMLHHLKGVYYGLIMPGGSSADIVRAYSISKEINLSAAWGVALMSRLMGLGVLLVLSIVGFFYMDVSFLGEYTGVMLLFLSMIFTVGAYLSLNKKLTSRVRVFLTPYLPLKVMKQIESIREGVFVLKSNKKALLINLIITVIIQTMLILNVSLALFMISGKVIYIEIFALFPLVELVSGLQPLTPNGAGVREGLSLGVFKYLGLTITHFGIYVLLIIYMNLLKVACGVPLLFSFLKKKPA